MSPPLREIRDRIPTIALLASKAESLLSAYPRQTFTSELLDFQKALLTDPVRSHIMLFAPALSHHPLPDEAALELRLNSRLKSVPVMIGWTEHDGRPFCPLYGAFEVLLRLSRCWSDS